MTKPNMVLFTNWLNEDFVGKWAGNEEVFKPGQSRYVEDWKGRHYAKHLIDQHLNNEGIPTSHFSRTELTKKCFGEKIEASAETNIASEIFTKNKELEKKESKQPEKDPEQPKSEEKKPESKEFPDLKDGNN